MPTKGYMIQFLLLERAKIFHADIPFVVYLFLIYKILCAAYTKVKHLCFVLAEKELDSV